MKEQASTLFSLMMLLGLLLVPVPQVVAADDVGYDTDGRRDGGLAVVPRSNQNAGYYDANGRRDERQGAFPRSNQDAGDYADGRRDGELVRQERQPIQGE